MRYPFLASLALLFAACSPSAIIEKGLTAPERSTMRGAIDDISRGDSASLARKAPPELAARIQSVFAPMRQALPASPLQVSVTNADWGRRRGVRTAHAVYQVHGRSGWALVNVTTHTTAGRTMLAGIYVWRIAGEPRSLNSFTFQRSGVAKIVMLFAMAAAVGLTILALIRVWRSGLFERRWLWTIGSLIGVMTLRLNCSTGHFYFQPISAQLFSASASKQPIYAPWILAVSVPLIALIALFRRRKGPADGAVHANDTA